MRLQLDTAVTGAGIDRSAEAAQTAPAAGSGTDSRRVGDSAGADSIQISGASSALSSLAADRAARVQQLTAVLQDGSYSVSGSQVGRAIVDDAVSQAQLAGLP
jgi:anti-sigma28 factor (negative regulator of flagellin synthesis)